MQKISNTFIIIILIFITSCQKIPQRDTAVLSEKTQALVDFFLKENEKWILDDKQLVIEGYINNDRSCFYLNLYNNDSSIYKPYGKCNGIVHYKGYDILLYGDSWNDFFWKGDTIFEIPNMNNPEELGWFYDPTEWDIAICYSDTTICRQESKFSFFLSLPYEEYKRVVCDSIQKIISK